jgi:hypothetical protein
LGDETAKVRDVAVTEPAVAGTTKSHGAGVRCNCKKDLPKDAFATIMSVALVEAVNVVEFVATHSTKSCFGE